MNETTHWFGTAKRDQFHAAIESISWWRRFLLCHIQWTKWRRASAADKTAIYALTVLGDDDLFNRLVRISDELYADIYNIPLS